MQVEVLRIEGCHNALEALGQARAGLGYDDTRVFARIIAMGCGDAFLFFPSKCYEG